MSRIVITDTVGEVFIYRENEKKKVTATRYKRSRTVKNKDIIETGEKSYALGVGEYVVTSNPVKIDVFPNSKVQLMTKPGEKKIIPIKGLLQIFTNWPVELPFTELTYTHKKYDYSDDSIFMIEKEPNKIIIASHIGSTPLIVKHTILNKEVKITNYQQAVLTKEAIKLEDVNEKYREAFRSVRDRQYKQIDEIVNQQLLMFYQNLCRFQKQMAAGIEWAINLMTREEVIDYVNTWEKNLKKSLRDMPSEIREEGEEDIKKAIEEWQEHREYLLELKFSGKNKKLYGMEGEEYLDLINEIKQYLPQEVYEENIRVYKQYQKIINRAQEDGEIEKSPQKEKIKEKKKKTKPKTELDLKQDKLNQEIEEGLAQLESEIAAEQTASLSGEEENNIKETTEDNDEFSEEKLAELVKEIEEK
jgi:hypothetical protein